MWCSYSPFSLYFPPFFLFVACFSYSLTLRSSQDLAHISPCLIFGLHLFTLSSRKSFYTYVGFEVLTAEVMKSTVFWDMRSCSSLNVNRRFGVICRVHLQGCQVSKARNQRGAGSEQSLLGLFVNPEDEGDMLFRNVVWLSTDYTALCPGSHNTSFWTSSSQVSRNLPTFHVFCLTLKITLGHSSSMYSIRKPYPLQPDLAPDPRVLYSCVFG
jgi:hypothetical protein